MMKFVQNHYQFFQNDRRLIPDDKVILRTAMLAVKNDRFEQGYGLIWCILLDLNKRFYLCRVKKNNPLEWIQFLRTKLKLD